MCPPLAARVVAGLSQHQLDRGLNGFVVVDDKNVVVRLVAHRRRITHPRSVMLAPRMRRDSESPRGGIVRGARRPPGWIAPGPPPAAAPPDDGDGDARWPAPGEDLCWLAGDWRILQRLDGHRWSLDDLVTAWLAARDCPAPPARALDLGCGIGTVLLFLAWRFPSARLVGVEAQEVSFELARRSLAWNGVEARVELRHADFRAPAAFPDGGVFDLVTGTPPYFPPGSGRESDHVQRAPCRFEHLGGIEDYCCSPPRRASPWARASSPAKRRRSRRASPPPRARPGSRSSAGST